MDFKSLFDSLDKVTDILNLGRLVFYTATGYLGVLPVCMTLHMLAQTQGPLAPYWRQFLYDLIACSSRYEVWIAALVFGFVIVGVAYALTNFKPAPREAIDQESYDYQYPRLFSGGVTDAQRAMTKDYAAWLISEYYRYVEIVWYIPYAVFLSLPVYALYSFTYLFCTLGKVADTTFNAAHLAFGLWTIAAVLAWSIVWPRFWLPKIVQPVYDSWVSARRAGIAGLKNFVGDNMASEGKTPLGQETSVPAKEVKEGK
ncbi:MAG: hypothetical protein ACJ71U_05865 [Terriglobales bacterium]